MILFLDFDGVLHPEVSGAEDFCRLPLLWHLLRKHPELEVVFSTSWREIYSPEQMVKFVTLGGGEELGDRFVGSNPQVHKPPFEDDYSRRELECIAWLEGNRLQKQPWLALDDVAYWFSSDSPNHYLVNYEYGLTVQDIEEISRHITRAIRYARK